MRMNRKIIAVASIIAIAAIVISVTSDSALDESTISQTIFVDAIYDPKNKIVKIMYNDNSKKTNLATLEILGMEKTFHKEFSQSSFVETVKINSEPKYGWSTTPVVFSINHDQFGKIGLKTEIYEQGESKPRIIYSKI
jgi:hypothetical protein|uniref:Uncharacterized protein n=2 Tax=environmental samples TaxID=651140 RepID=A0A075GFQ2_9ARCH|nr:hypothetical protein [uncultured marine thaumarchaeote KM3_08_B06]AIF02040.1 hypothetical protein [uncultured marine thaumarchaeote KM3_153_B11]